MEITIPFQLICLTTSFESFFSSFLFPLKQKKKRHRARSRKITPLTREIMSSTIPDQSPGLPIEFFFSSSFSSFSFEVFVSQAFSSIVQIIVLSLFFFEVTGKDGIVSHRSHDSSSLLFFIGGLFCIKWAARERFPLIPIFF